MEPLIELPDAQKERIREREKKIHEELSKVRSACDDDVAIVRQMWGGFFDLHQEDLPAAIEEAGGTLRSAESMAAQVLFNVHSTEYRLVVEDPIALTPLLAKLRERVIAEFGAHVRPAVQHMESGQIQEAELYRKIESAAASVRGAIAAQSSEGSVGTASANFWRLRRGEFAQLRDRQQQVLQQPTHPKWLKGYCFGVGDSVRDGMDASLVSDFEDIVTQSAYALGCPPEEDPLRFWVHALADDLRKDRRPEIRRELFAGGDGGGIIQDLIGSSLGYCSRLAAAAERQTRAKANLDKTRMSDTSQPATGGSSSNGPVTPGNLASSRVWRTLGAEFDALRQRENELLAGRRDDLRLCASCMYPRTASKYGSVSIEKGINRSVIDTYVEIGTRAGIELGCPANVKPVEFWIDCLYRNLLDLKSDELFAPSATGGLIVRLIESSASYCLRLSIAAREQARPLPERETAGQVLTANQGERAGAISTEEITSRSGVAIAGTVAEAAPEVPKKRGRPASIDATHSGKQQQREDARRAKTRSAWIDQELAQRTDWTSDTDIAANGGPTYNTIRRYRSGATSSREPYVRRKLAGAFGCALDGVPK